MTLRRATRLSRTGKNLIFREIPEHTTEATFEQKNNYLKSDHNHGGNLTNENTNYSTSILPYE